MTGRKSDPEEIARAFPSPHNSRPARSLTYQCDGHIYEAMIGRKRRQCDNTAGSGTGGEPSKSVGQASGNIVLSIVAGKAAVEIWSREPACGWPNPSLIAPDSVLAIDYLEDPGIVATMSR